MRYRTEKDPLGKKQVPSEALYGIHTQRASENFPISGQTLPAAIFDAIAQIKIAAALANKKEGLLDRKKADAIVRAAKEIPSGEHDEHFVIDQFQAGAGTPTHMNVNEVIANRAIEILQRKKARRGDYRIVHPNDHVNMGQSTNNVVPTAIKMVAVTQTHNLLASLMLLEKALLRKAAQFSDVVKAGRTHLQDAVPVTLGGEFNAYATAVSVSRKRIAKTQKKLLVVNVGRNAIGTGINTKKQFRQDIIKELQKLTKQKWISAKDPLYATQNVSVFLEHSQSLMLLATDLTKMANDLRLLCSGPKTGMNELLLPAVEPGSSIMPGKVNPSMLEMLNMVCFQVMGNNETIARSCAAGQLELNVMTPVIAKNLLESLHILTTSIKEVTNRCIKGIKVNKKQTTQYLTTGVGIATALNPIIGYEKAAAVVDESLKTGKSVMDIVIDRKLLTRKEAQKLFSAKKLTKPNK